MLKLESRELARWPWFACSLGCSVVWALLYVYHWVEWLQQEHGFGCSAALAKCQRLLNYLT